MKIVLTRSMLPGDIQYIKNKLDKEIAGKYELTIPKEFTEDCICNEISDADVILGPFVTKKMIESAKKLKLIQIPWTGMDSFDFSVVQDSNIPICNTHSNADAVAEIAVTLLLDLLKKVSFHDRKMRLGNWNRDNKPLSLKSKMLCEQTVCILGFGNIGSKIAKLIKPFETHIIAVSKHSNSQKIADEFFLYEQIDEAIEKSDIVICTLPLTNDTRGLLNEQKLSIMKEKALLVNVSRADVIDEKSLWNALVNEKLGGFASDVWWKTPKRGETKSYPSEKYNFWELDNVILSPHRAGFIENRLPHLDGAIENIVNLYNGRNLNCQVDKIKQY